jgi:hypothetical protein
MKTKRGYLPKDSIYPLLGLNTFDPSPQVDPRMSPDLLNIELIKGEVGKRKGYAYLGSTLTDPVIGVVEFQALDGTKTLLAFTTKKQYKYDTGSNDWTNITYQVASVDVNWTGAVTDVFEYAIVSGKNVSGTYTTWIIATNGKDQPRYWDGTASKFALYAPTGITNFKTCKTLTSFYDHILLGNISYTSGSPDRTLVVWSETQELTKFADTDQDAGSAILTDTQGDIVKFVQFGDRMMIYSDNTIHSITYIAGVSVFTFEKILQETRLISPRSIVNIGPFHLFLSQENVIYFDGTKLWGHIGNRIYRSYRDELDASNRHLAFAFHDVAKMHVYFNYPIVGDSQIYKTEYKIQNLLDSTWTRIKYNDSTLSMGFFSRDTNLACNSAQFVGVTCSGTDFPCSQGSIKGGFPVRVFGTSTGRVCLCDDTIPNDAGTAAESRWDSIDFTVPEGYESELGRWLEIEMDLKGFEADVLISLDQGQTYQFVETLALTGRYDKYRVQIDEMSKSLRVRIKNQCPSSSFYLRWLRVWLRPGGAA